MSDDIPGRVWEYRMDLTPEERKELREKLNPKPRVEPLAAIQAWALFMLLVFWTPLALLIYWAFIR